MMTDNILQKIGFSTRKRRIVNAGASIQPSPQVAAFVKVYVGHPEGSELWRR